MSKKVLKKAVSKKNVNKFIKVIGDMFGATDVDEQLEARILNGFRKVESVEQKTITKEIKDFHKQIRNTGKKKAREQKLDIKAEASVRNRKIKQELDEAVKSRLGKDRDIPLDALSDRTRSEVKNKVPSTIYTDKELGLKETQKILDDLASDEITLNKMRKLTIENESVIEHDKLVNRIGNMAKFDKDDAGNFILNKSMTEKSSKAFKESANKHRVKRNVIVDDMKLIDDQVEAIYKKGVPTGEGKETLNRLEKEMSNLESSLKKIDDEFHANKFKGVEYENLTTQDMHPLELVETIFKESTDRNLKDKIFKEFYVDVYTRRQKVFNNIRPTKTSMINGLYSVHTNSAILYDVMQKDGLKYSADRVKEFYRYNKDAQVASTQLKTHMNGVRDEFKSFSEVSQRKIRQYVEESNINNVVQARNTKIKHLMDARFVNVESAQAMKMTVKEVEMAHIMMNTNRIYQATKEGLELGTFERLTTVPSKYNEWREVGKYLNPKDKKWAKDFQTGYGDQNMSYWHKWYTDEALGRQQGMKQFGKSAEYTPAYKKARTTNDLNYMDRHSPMEELDKYMDDFVFDAVQIGSTKKLAQIAESLSGEVVDSIKLVKGGETPEVMTKYKDIFAQLKKSQEAVFNRPKFMERAGYTGLAQSMFFGTIDISTAVALSSPITAGFNALQPVGNSAMFHGLTNIFKGYATLGKAMYEATPELFDQAIHTRGLFKSVTSQKWIGKAIETVSKQKSLEPYKDVLDYYFHSHSPNVLMTDAYHMTPTLTSTFNFVTLPFQASDIYARGVTAVSVAKQVDAVLGGYKGRWWKNDKALAKITKSFHLNEFNEIDREHLFSLLRNGKTQQFRREYASNAIQYELFDYSRWGRATYLNQSVVNPLASRALRFLSWNMFYTELMRGVKASWDAGDKEPLIKLARNASMWYATAVGAHAMTDDDSIWGAITYKGIARTPFLGSYMNVASTAMRPLGGIGTATISALFAPISIAMEESTKFLTQKNKTPNTYNVNQAKSILKYSPIGKAVRDGLSLFEEDSQ